MFPIQSSTPPAKVGSPSPPATSGKGQIAFNISAPPLPDEARAENETVLLKLLSRFEEFGDHAIGVLNQSPMTVRWCRDAFRNYMKFIREGIDLPRGTFETRINDIDGWVRWNRERQLSAISTNGYWRAVKMFWNDVAARDGVQHPFAGKKQPAVPTRVPKAHTPDECRRILSAAENYPWETQFHRARALALLGCSLLAGLRRNELLSLEVRDIDCANSTIRIRNGKGRGGGKERVCYMTDELRRLIRSYETARAGAHLVCPEFFASVKYRRGIKIDTLKRIIGYVRAASGIRFTLHTLRHSYVSWLIRSGVPLPVASELAGHTKIETTMQYIRVFDADKRAAVQRLRML
jgi:integrase